MAVIEQEISERYAIYLGDCIETLKSFPKASIHLSLYSPPFRMLYVYSSSERDLSNCTDYQKFFEHYAFAVRELYRVTLPGRMTAVHCADVLSGNSGNDHLMDFPGDIIRLHEREGWYYVARYHIWKEPLLVRNRTMLKNLMHKTLTEDSSRCNAAGADYLLVFRRKGTNKIPIQHPNGLLRYAGERQMPAELLHYKGYTGKQTENLYSHWIWRQYASAFWDDIRIDNIVDCEGARDPEDEAHPHPLQLDVIERCCVLWSNPDETVISPFMGVGSEVYGALINGRKGIGIELKPNYYYQAKKNIKKAITGIGAEENISLELDYGKPDAEPETVEQD